MQTIWKILPENLNTHLIKIVDTIGREDLLHDNTSFNGRLPQIDEEEKAFSTLPF